jgi:hypothetical protein
MNYLSAGLIAIVLAVSGCATGEAQKSRAREAPWKEAAAARTRADHDELAAWYVREAESARERAAAHRKMRDSYASSSGYFDLMTSMAGHCTNLVLKYQEAANENAALAELHRRLAGEAKE